MKVIGHGQGESCLKQGRDDKELTPEDQHPRSARKRRQGKAFPQEALQSPGNHADIEPDLGQSGSQCGVISDGIQVSQSLRKRLCRPLKDWSSDSRNHEDTQKTQLESGSKER